MEPPEGTGGGAAKKMKLSPAPPIATLGNDLLGENRQPPLVGFILTDRGDQHFPRRSPNLLFVQATRNPKLAAAAANGDFFFEDLPAVDSDAEEEGYDWHEWRLRGCDGGRFLLSRGREGLDLAVYDPIARTAVFLRPAGFFGPSPHMVRYAIVVDEADGSFLVIGFDFEGGVFSSRTGKWVEINMEKVKLEKGDVTYKNEIFDTIRLFNSDGMAAGRFAYWRSETKKQHFDPVEKILVLDTTTMEWSVITAPFPVGESYSPTVWPTCQSMVACVSSPARSNAFSSGSAQRFWMGAQEGFFLAE